VTVAILAISGCYSLWVVASWRRPRAVRGASADQTTRPSPCPPENPHDALRRVVPLWPVPARPIYGRGHGERAVSPAHTQQPTSSPKES